MKPANAPMSAVRMAALTMTLGLVACSGGGPAATSTSTATRTQTATYSPTPTHAPTHTVAPSTAVPPTSTARPAPAPWIAYQGQSGLALIRSDGTEDHVFPSTVASRARHPDWSPDGEWLAYRLDGPGDATAIWVSRIDGSGARRLVDCRAPCGFADDPAWSVDGTNIAYWRNGDHELQAIHVLDVESGEESLIIPGAPGEGPIRPRWSPDGTKLVVEIEQYSDDGEYLASDLGLIDLNAQTPVLSALTTGEPLAGYPDWDANSNAILFQAHNADPFSLTGDPVQLFTIRPDGTGLRQLTERTAGEPFIALPAWADHGESILATLIHSTEMSPWRAWLPMAAAFMSFWARAGSQSSARIARRGR